MDLSLCKEKCGEQKAPASTITRSTEVSVGVMVRLRVTVTWRIIAADPNRKHELFWTTFAFLPIVFFFKHCVARGLCNCKLSVQVPRIACT